MSAKGKVIAGHGRLLAARRLELAEVPVIVCGDLSPAQVRALRIADNRIAEASSWDEDLLSREIAALLDLDYEIDVLGFDPDEVAALLAEPTAGLTDPDAVPLARAGSSTPWGITTVRSSRLGRWSASRRFT